MQAEALLSLAVAVAGERAVQDVVTSIVRGLAAQPGVALARIWFLLPGDICDTCFRKGECADHTYCFQLVASAGASRYAPAEASWSFLNGQYRRIPRGPPKSR